MIQELQDSITGFIQGMQGMQGMFPCLPLSFCLCACFALGTVLGSACACLGERISRGESLLTRSRCPHCGRVLKFRHMVPLAGLILLKGRCAFCGARIPRCSAFYEAGMGLLCAILYAQAACSGPGSGHGTGFVLVQIVFLFFLCLAAETDRRTGYLPDRVLVLALPAALCLALEGSIHAMPGALVNAFVNAFVCAFVHAALACLLFLMLRLIWLKIYRTEAIGLGDAKLVFILGLATKGSVFLAVAAASLLAMLAALHPKVRRHFFVRDLAEKGAIPFGPFLAAGGIAAMILCR